MSSYIWFTINIAGRGDDIESIEILQKVDSSRVPIPKKDYLLTPSEPSRNIKSTPRPATGPQSVEAKVKDEGNSLYLKLSQPPSLLLPNQTVTQSTITLSRNHSTTTPSTLVIYPPLHGEECDGTTWDSSLKTCNVSNHLLFQVKWHRFISNVGQKAAWSDAATMQEH